MAEKTLNLDNLRIINHGSKHGKWTNKRFFSFTMVPFLAHNGPKNTSIFGQKLPIRKAHHTFLESRLPEVTKALA